MTMNSFQKNPTCVNMIDLKVFTLSENQVTFYFNHVLDEVDEDYEPTQRPWRAPSKWFNTDRHRITTDETEYQDERERNALSAFYFEQSLIPPTPKEPEDDSFIPYQIPKSSPVPQPSSFTPGYLNPQMPFHQPIPPTPSPYQPYTAAPTPIISNDSLLSLMNSLQNTQSGNVLSNISGMYPYATPSPMVLFVLTLSKLLRI